MAGIVDNALDAIVSVNSRLRIVLVNGAAGRMFVPELASNPWLDFERS
jgi:PAS domain-containing protein